MDEFDDDWTDSDPDLEARDSIPLVTKKATPDAADSSVADGDSKPATDKSQPAAAATAEPEPAESEAKPAKAPSDAQATEPKADTKPADAPSDAKATEPKAETKPADAAAAKPEADTKRAEKVSDAPAAKSETKTAKAKKPAESRDSKTSEPPSGGPDSLDRELSMLSQPPASAQEAKPARSQWPHVEAEPMQLGDALMLDVLFGRWTTSLRTVFLASIGLSAVLVGLAVLAVLRSAERASSTEASASAQPTASAPARVVASAAGSAAASAQPTQQDPVALARTGDAKAMEALQAKPARKRSAAEAAALVRGHEVLRQRELEKLGEELLPQPKLEYDHYAWRTLYEFVQDPRTATDALLIIAKLPGPASADLLYKVWTETRERTDASALAEELVYGPDVRPKASAALSVALDLRSAEDCERFHALLPRATEHGDKRSLRLLGRLLKKRGCGRKKLQDCYKCLREGKELTKAIQAVKRRDAPSFQPEPEAEPESESKPE